MSGFTLSRDVRVNLLIGIGHFLSHFYTLCLPPLFLAWQAEFGVSFAELGLSVALMSGMSGLLQTPVGFLVDRYGARRFLIGGILVMSVCVAAMSAATAYWQILVLSLISGTGNSVFHPADYAILTGSVNRERMGRAFALHTFTGNLGFAAAPPVTAFLLLVLDWRSAILLLGAIGIPLIGAVLWQIQILNDQAKPPEAKKASALAGAKLLLSPQILCFFGFFLLGAMAGGGLQAWLITVLHEVSGLGLEAASSALTGYVVGGAAGTLLGGWFADRSARHLPFTILTTTAAAGLLLVIPLAPLPAVATMAVLFGSGVLTGASRTPRDVMVKDAAPPGEVGKIFGFVSSGLPLGGAITPVIFGALMDAGRPALVLVLSAALLLASLLFLGTARAGAKRRPLHVPAE
jgi:MFS transporter, FSR family, fosmidomycin resistance protein